MTHIMAAPLTQASVSEIAGSTQSFAPLADMLHELARAFLGSYRPERHYMRGPGPKWRERCASLNRRDPRDAL